MLYTFHFAFTCNTNEPAITDPMLKAFLKKYTGHIYVLAIIGLSVFLLINTYDQKVAPLGDNANYYILGSSLAQGSGFSDLHLDGKPQHNHYPPGYPVAIAVLKTVGLGSVEAVKHFNQLLLALSGLLIYFLAVKLTSSRLLAFLVAILCVSNYHLLEFSSIMMSELLYLFLSLLAIFGLIRSDWKRPWFKDGWFWGLVVLMVSLFYIRTAGIALVLAALLWFFLQKKKKHSLALLVSFIALIIPWQIRSARLGGSSYLKQLLLINPYAPQEGELGFGTLLERIGDNFLRYLGREVPSSMFNFLRVEDYDQPVEVWYWLAGVVIAAGVIYGLVNLSRKYRVLFLCYLVLSFGVLMVWPPVWEGVRFILPLLPILLLLFLNGLSAVLNKLTIRFQPKPKPVLAAISVAVLVTLGMVGYTQSLDFLYQRAKLPDARVLVNYYGLAEWARENVPDSSLICTRKGELFYLKAERPTVRYLFTKDRQAQIDFLREKNVDYVVATYIGFSSTNDYLIPAIKLNPLKFEIVYELKEPNAYLMKFHPERGYSGAWNGDKKEGYGEFNFLDGRKYSGQWVNDQKEGPGKMQFENGYYVTGQWKADMLSGPMLIFNNRDEQIDSVFVRKPINPMLNFQ